MLHQNESTLRVHTKPNRAGDLLSVLKQAPLFATLSEPDLSLLAARARYCRYSANELLFSEGEPCKGLYVVVSGLIRIFKTSSSGREHVLSLDGPGNSVAELPVIDGDPYPASAAAAKDSEVVFISRKDFRSLCLEHPELALRLLEVVGRRVRRLVNIVEELSFTTVRQRLISYLLRKTKMEGRERPSPAVFALDSYQAIAAEIGTVRDLVSRTLMRLQSDGLVRVEEGKITIPDAAALERELVQQNARAAAMTKVVAR